MKKLTLDLSELRVESFRTDQAEARRGTVRGHVETDCCTISCGGTCGIFPDSGVPAALAATTPPGRCSAFCCV